MQNNPSYPTGDDPSQLPDYLRIDRSPDAAAQVPPSPEPYDGRNAATDMIRQKLAAIYGEEEQASRPMPAQPVSYGQPAADTSVSFQEQGPPQSKHQQYLNGLHASGQAPHEVHAAWNQYYSELPDHEKHEVWQEFYGAKQAQNQATEPQPQPYQQPSADHSLQPQFQPLGSRTIQPLQQSGQYGHADQGAYQPALPAAFSTGPAENSNKSRPSLADHKQRALDSLKSAGKLRQSHFFHSLAFGLTCGVIAVIVFMFSFFNDFILAPFIQPGRTGVETPVIVDPSSSVAADSKTTQVIIPKINVQIPVDYSQTTTSEASIETALDSAVVHYPTTVMPGQQGNAAFFGHSSNNIFNPGKYKFAFVLLHKLTNGDTFYLTYGGKTYAYEVISHQIVEPTQVSVLGPVAGQTATATLITCDPPGTSLHRLVVVGKQISPDPANNAAPSQRPNPTITASDTGLPGNGPTLLSRLWHSIF